MSNIPNLQTIRQHLLEQRRALLKRLETKETSDRSSDLLNPDQADRALISRDTDRQTLLLNHDQQQLDAIDQALTRMDAGTYGICTTCGQSIQPARLEIMPTAVLCIDCQRLHDK